MNNNEYLLFESYSVEELHCGKMFQFAFSDGGLENPSIVEAGSVSHVEELLILLREGEAHWRNGTGS